MTEEYENKLVQCPMCNGLGHVRIGPQSQYILSTIFDSLGKSRNTIGWPCVSCPLCAGYGSVSELLAVAFHLMYPVYKFSNPYLGPKGPLPSRITINELLRDVGRK